MSEHDNKWRVLAIDGIEPEAIAIEAIPLLFADATDIIEIEVSDTAALIARLEHEWTRDRALQLLLIVVDSESDHEVRADAVAAADELLRDDCSAHQLVRNLFFSRPMPVNCDLQASLRIANSVGAQLVETLLSEVADAQDGIGRIASWFDGLPTESPEQRRAKDKLEKAFGTMAAVNFPRVHMLVSLFDGDPDKWIQFLESHGTAEERASDLPFAKALKCRITENLSSIERLRQTVDGIAALVSDIPSDDKRDDSRARNPVDNRKSIA